MYVYISMPAMISKILENDETLEFTLSGVDRSIANALRRTVLSDIQVNAFITETFETNQCTIKVNTSRFHNEIIKQRLACIPIMMSDLEKLPGKYVVEVSKQNDESNSIYVTTEDFKIRNKETGEYMPRAEVQKIFPPNSITGDYILFVRLRPKLSPQIPGEELSLECEFGVSSARENSMYNVACVCSYGNTIDQEKAMKEWSVREAEMRASSGANEEDIEFEKKNFELLDAQRYFVENSYDFKIKGVGMYDNKQIVRKACDAAIDKLTNFIAMVDGDQVFIKKGETLSENMYDITLDNEDYTLGHMLERALYDKYYTEEKIMNFCGFFKPHPHETYSVVRVGYNMVVDQVNVRQHINAVLKESIEKFQEIAKVFIE